MRLSFLIWTDSCVLYPKVCDERLLGLCKGYNSFFSEATQSDSMVTVWFGSRHICIGTTGSECMAVIVQEPKSLTRDQLHFIFDSVCQLRKHFLASFEGIDGKEFVFPLKVDMINPYQHYVLKYGFSLEEYALFNGPFLIGTSLQDNKLIFILRLLELVGNFDSISHFNGKYVQRIKSSLGMHCMLIVKGDDWKPDEIPLLNFLDDIVRSYKGSAIPFDYVVKSECFEFENFSDSKAKNLLTSLSNQERSNFSAQTFEGKYITHTYSERMSYTIMHNYPEDVDHIAQKLDNLHR